MRGYPHAETGSCLYAGKGQTDADFLGRRNLQAFITKHNSAFVNNPAVGLSELASSVNVGIAALKAQGLDDPDKGLWTAEAFDAPDAHRLFGGDRGDKLATQLQHLVFPQGKACNDDEVWSAAYDVIYACQQDQAAMMIALTDVPGVSSRF